MRNKTYFPVKYRQARITDQAHKALPKLVEVYQERMRISVSYADATSLAILNELNRIEAEKKPE